MTDAEREVTFIIWEDCRALISALKKQRWSVTQWVVTVNLALSAASVSDLVVKTHSSWLFLGFELGVSALGIVLLYHYNERITRVRERLTTTTAYVREHYFNYK